MTSILLVIIYLAFISLGLPDSLLGSAWPVMYGELSVPVSYAGVISMIIAGGTIISSLFSGKLIRKLGTGKVTMLSVALTALALMGFAFSHSFLFLCLWGIPYGLGAGSVDAALNHYVAVHYKARHMSWLHCFWGVGATVGPYLMGRCIADGKGWNQGYQLIHRDLIHHMNQPRAMGARARHADGTRHTTPHQPAPRSSTSRYSKSIKRSTDSAVVAQLVQIRITV